LGFFVPRSRRSGGGALVAAAVTTCIGLQPAHATSPREVSRPAQVSPWHVEAWVTGLTAQPFATSGPLSDWGFGASLGMGARRDPLPISIGANIAGIHWGTVTVPVELQLGDRPAQAVVSIAQQTIFLDLWLRAALPRGVVRPYLEVAGGLKLIDSQYTLTFDDGQGATSVFGDATTPASSLGVGLGVDLMIARSTVDRDSGLLVTLGARHLWGNRVSIEHATYGRFETDTNTVLISLGFSMKTRVGKAPTKR
jgi:hypothetical protein